MQQLIFQGSKYSFFLLYFLSLPVLLQTGTLLHLWLKIVPEYTILFCQLVLIDTLINCISGPLMTAAQATGKIKKYQVVVGGLLLFNLPLSYLLLKQGFAPQFTLYITISLSITALFARLWILKNLIKFSVPEFFRQVLLKVILVTILSIIIPLIAKQFITREIISFFVTCLLSVISVIAIIYWVGLKGQERNFAKEKILQKISKLRTKS